MSSSYPDSDYDYSSTEETDDTEESEPSEKNTKQAPPPPPKKETKNPTESESDDSDYSESDDSEQSESVDQSSNPRENQENKEKQTPPKPNATEQVTNKNASPEKSESADESDSDYSESDDSVETESSSPKKEVPLPPKEKPPAAKEEQKKSTKASSDKKTEDSEYDYSSTYSEKPKPVQTKAVEPSAANKTEDSDYDDYYSESEKPKEEPKKSAKTSSTQKKTKSEPSSEKPKESQKKSDKSSSANKKTETKNATPAEQPTRKSTNTNSIDLSQPPDFSVDPAVIEEASHKKVDRYGWIQTKEPSSQEKKLLDAELAKEEERSKKWKKMMKSDKWPYYKTRRGFRVVKERTIKGIPNDVRAKAWILLLDDPENRKPNRGTVQQFFDQGVPSVEHTIRVDIPRTMPNVPEFLKTETREKLYHILRAYSNASGGGGYFQGMGFHAAIYLLYIKDEEKTFWCLYNLMMGDKHKVKDLFENEFSGLKFGKFYLRKNSNMFTKN